MEEALRKEDDEEEACTADVTDIENVQLSLMMIAMKNKSHCK